MSVYLIISHFRDTFHTQSLLILKVLPLTVSHKHSFNCCKLYTVHSKDPSTEGMFVHDFLALQEVIYFLECMTSWLLQEVYDFLALLGTPRSHAQVKGRGKIFFITVLHDAFLSENYTQLYIVFVCEQWKRNTPMMVDLCLCWQSLRSVHSSLALCCCSSSAGHVIQREVRRCPFMINF